MEASEPKWVIHDDIQYGVISLWLGGLQMITAIKVKEVL